MEMTEMLTNRQRHKHIDRYIGNRQNFTLKEIIIVIFVPEEYSRSLVLYGYEEVLPKHTFTIR